MLIEDKFTVSAPVDKVWDFLMDVPEVSKCMPGVDKIEVVDPDHIKAVMTAKIGFLSATFNVQMAVTERVPLQRLVLEGQGADKGNANQVQSRNTLELRALPEGGTEVAYAIESSVSGRFAILGDAAMRMKAREMSQEFVKNFRARVADRMLRV